jgi:B12-binding domain/radical SAM domain protein
MQKNNLILIHAPSVYDFRERSTLWGPISDLVPSKPVFEMYPIGFTTIAEYLERHGHRVRIINLAARMLLDKEFDVDEFIGSLNTASFGIDLHWLPHAHGSIELAHRIKQLHPATPVIFGGISSSYYHEDLITLPQVDYVLRGDSTEEPLRQLIESIETGQKAADLKKIPNLTWKDNKGSPQINPLTHVPDNLDYISIDYSHPVKTVARDLSLKNILPFTNWLKYPITAVLTCRGCTHNCAICGGSSYTFSNFLGRNKPAFRNPESLARDIRRISSFSRGPIFVLGDIRQAGMGYAKRFLNVLQGIKKPVIFEFFWPVDRQFMEMVAGSTRNFFVQLSPESHDQNVRQFTNNPFVGNSIQTSIEHILSAGCRRIDVFFMTGLPGQTYNSVLESIEYSNQLLEYFEGDPRLIFYISPLAPFLDPGSPAFENPIRYGYKKFCHSLDDHRRALLAPSWKYVLSYETQWMSRDDIVSSTYQAALLLNKSKLKFGHVKKEKSMLTEERIHRAIELMEYVDKLVATEDPHAVNNMLSKLRPQIDEVNDSTVCEKEDLHLPVGRRPVRIMRSFGQLAGDSVKRLLRNKPVQS